MRMPFLKAQSIGIIILGGLLVGAIALFWRTSDRARIPSASQPGINAELSHVAHNESQLLTKVKLRVVYFIPKDRQELSKNDWVAAATQALEMMRAFHRLQFRNSSDLQYDISPVPIIGDLDGLAYDGSDTNRGNLHAFKIIGEELNRRLGEIQTGDRDVFTVRLVVYEGVGALGGEGQILVSSGYVSQEAALAAAVLYHELGHTFGLQDAYEYEHGTPLDEDIMGLGRNKPIGKTYLSEKAKQELGIMH